MFIMLLLICSSLKSNAQYWNTIGNPAGINDFIGTTNSQHLKFYTVGNERMRLTTGGYLGIGITAPSSVLHVNSAGTGSLFRTDGLSTATNLWQLFTGGSEKFRLSIPASNSNVLLNATDPSGNLQIQTGNTSRLIIQKGSATNAYGVNTAGFITIGSIIPTTGIASPLHIQASQQANPQGWNRALTLSNNATLYFDGGLNASLFLANPSTNPLGNFYCGSATDLSSTATVDYAYSIHTTTAPTGSPLNSTTFFKNVFVSQAPASNVNSTNERKFGVNTNTPQNVVEINTASTSAVPGNSGLRLTDLTTASNVQSNPGSGVLSVNANGDVIYVDKNSVGNYCGGASNAITSDYEVPLNNYNYYFSNIGANPSQNGVKIGYSCSTPIMNNKLSVLQSNTTTVSVNTTAVNAINNNIAATPYKTFQGIYGESSGPSTNQNYVTKSNQIGGHFYAKNGFINIGTKGIAGNIPNNYVNSACIGGYFHSITNLANTTIGIGVVGISTNAGTNYGVYGAAPSGGANRAGYFNGLIEANGQFLGSDQMFKTNVSKIQSGLSIIKLLKPSTYYLDTVNFNQFNFDSNKQYGFIAQDLETVIPEIVHESLNPAIIDSLGNEITPAVSYKSVNYNAIIPINTQAIKELNEKVDKATLSDASIKTNVQDLSGSLQTILALRGVSFDWNHSVNQEIQLDSTNHIGFIAQEVQTVEPRLTFTGDNNLLHVDYNKVVPVLVEAIQEQTTIISHQDSMINELNNRLSNLENCINSLNLCNQNQTTQMAQPTTGQTISLNTVQSIVLNQNVPNPFAEQTVISYSIPESVKRADILFYDSNGKLINTVSIKERGNSQLNVFANDLSTGIYTYTLVADGQIVATKKMVKQ